MSRVERKQAVTIGDALQTFLRQSHLSSGLNTRRVFAAWDEASGAGNFTLKKFYRDGVLYITTSSSVVRSQLEFQKAALVEKINALLAQDELFFPDEAKVGFVKELRLK